MRRLLLAAHRDRSDFPKLRRLVVQAARQRGDTVLEIASTADEIERAAAYNLQGLPLAVVEGGAAVVLNPRSPHLRDVLAEL